MPEKAAIVHIWWVKEPRARVMNPWMWRHFRASRAVSCRGHVTLHVDPLVLVTCLPMCILAAHVPPDTRDVFEVLSSFWHFILARAIIIIIWSCVFVIGLGYCPTAGHYPLLAAFLCRDTPANAAEETNLTWYLPIFLLGYIRSMLLIILQSVYLFTIFIRRWPVFIPDFWITITTFLTPDFQLSS